VFLGVVISVWVLVNLVCEVYVGELDVVGEDVGFSECDFCVGCRCECDVCGVIGG